MEILIGMLVVGFVITGTLHIRYHSTMGVLDAELSQAGIRLGSTIIESWQNSKKTNFDLIAEMGNDFTITISSGQAAPIGFTKLKDYQVTVNHMKFLVTLSYKAQTTSVPATLNVQVSWPRAGKAQLRRICSLTTYMNL